MHYIKVSELEQQLDDALFHAATLIEPIFKGRWSDARTNPLEDQLKRKRSTTRRCDLRKS